MCENILEGGKPHMTVRGMHIACRIPKATNTHSQHVILLFHCKNAETPLNITLYLHFLSCSSFLPCVLWFYSLSELLCGDPCLYSKYNMVRNWIFPSSYNCCQKCIKCGLIDIPWLVLSNFDVLLTVHLSIFISVFNQLDAQNLFHNKFYFMPLRCFKHMCSSSGGQNCITQPLVSSHL